MASFSFSHCLRKNLDLDGVWDVANASVCTVLKLCFPMTYKCIRLVEASVVCCGDPSLSLPSPPPLPPLSPSLPVYRKVHTKAKIEIQLQGTGLWDDTACRIPDGRKWPEHVPWNSLTQESLKESLLSTLSWLLNLPLAYFLHNF